MPDHHESPIVCIAGDGSAMSSAMIRARNTFKYLWRELTWEYRRIVPALDLCAVKLAFSDLGGNAPDVEHMWLSEICFNGDTVNATLMSEPHRLRSVQAGDEFTFGLHQIEDWIYVLDGHVNGGFTIQCLRAMMSRSERREHDHVWGFTFPNPERVVLVPRWGTQAQPGLLRRVFGGVAGARQDPDVEHPMSLAMAGNLAAAIARNPEGLLRSQDDDGLTTLHSLALGGSAVCVKILINHGADITTKTNAGHTARDLAECLGWPIVADVLSK